MINSILDQILPDGSDDEDDESPDVGFLFRTSAEQRGAEPAAEAAEGFSPPPRAPVPGEELPEHCRRVVVCGPGAASAFALSAFAMRPVDWTLEVAAEPEERVLPAPRSPAFHVLGEGPSCAAVVVLGGPVPADMAFAWAEALLGAFGNATEVVILDRIFRAEWRTLTGEERPLEPHLCGLWTAAWDDASAGASPTAGGLQPLPIPNLVDGLTAALLSKCEAARRRCLVALALQDGAHLGVGCLCAFEQLSPTLTGLGILPADWRQPNYQKAVASVRSPTSMSIYA